MRRREVLASGTALLSVAVAGCGHPSVVLDMDEARSEDVAHRAAQRADPGSEAYRVATAAIENDSTTRRGRRELFDRADAVRVEDAFYEIEETPMETAEVTVYTVEIDFDPDDAAAVLGAIEYADLPETDRTRLDSVVGDDHPSSEGMDAGVSYGTAEEVGEDSVFVPDRQYDILIHDGDRYRVRVDSRTTEETTYRYEATEIAGSVEAFAETVRDQYRFVLSGLSDAEREVVEEAIDGGYYEDSEAFRSVIEEIRSHDGLEEADFYGTWLVEYENVEYLTYAEW